MVKFVMWIVILWFGLCDMELIYGITIWRQRLFHSRVRCMALITWESFSSHTLVRLSRISLTTTSTRWWQWHWNRKSQHPPASLVSARNNNPRLSLQLFIVLTHTPYSHPCSSLHNSISPRCSILFPVPSHPPSILSSSSEGYLSYLPPYSRPPSPPRMDPLPSRLVQHALLPHTIPHNPLPSLPQNPRQWTNPGKSRRSSQRIQGISCPSRMELYSPFRWKREECWKGQGCWEGEEGVDWS